MTASDLSTRFFDRLPQLHILVIGDVMIDRYIRGKVDRISPEAPVPVLVHQVTEDRLGGAANVALNICSLGARLSLIALRGEDPEGEILEQLLQSSGIDPAYIVCEKGRRTTLKSRVLAGRQQLLRMDSEDDFDLSQESLDALLRQIRQICAHKKPDLIILQDYNKGMLTALSIPAILELARQENIPVIVDPKKKNFLAYRGVRLFKPNLKEIREQVPFAVEPELPSLLQAAAHLRAQLGASELLITLSERGMFLLDEKAETFEIPVRPRPITDVCGAGDTVISVVGLALAAGLSSLEAARLANEAGGLVCEFPGVVPISRYLLEKSANAIFS